MWRTVSPRDSRCRTVSPRDPRALFPLSSAHGLHLPAPVDTAEAEGQQQGEDDKDQDEHRPQRGHHLFNKKQQH